MFDVLSKKKYFYFLRNQNIFMIYRYKNLCFRAYFGALLLFNIISLSLNKKKTWSIFLYYV